MSFSLPMWHDDSSPFRRQPLELRRKLEIAPSNRNNLPLPGEIDRTPTMAICHPDRLHLARGFCFNCYHRLYKAGAFDENRYLRATTDQLTGERQ